MGHHRNAGLRRGISPSLSPKDLLGTPEGPLGVDDQVVDLVHGDSWAGPPNRISLNAAAVRHPSAAGALLAQSSFESLVGLGQFLRELGGGLLLLGRFGMMVGVILAHERTV